MTDSARNLTALLKLAADGNKEAEEELISLVYVELRQIARRMMRREAQGHTLQTTALVNEAYIRLADPGAMTFSDRTHFFAVAARVMRRILVDHARAKHAKKRDAGVLVPLEESSLSVDLKQPESFLALDAALTRLSKLDERQGRIVEMRFFAGMTLEETAEALHLSSRTVKREWQMARAWLLGELRT